MIPLCKFDRIEEDPFCRYKRPSIIIKQEGSGNGKVTILQNFEELCKSLNRPDKIVGSHISKTLATMCRFDKKSKRYILNGHFSAEKVDVVVQQYIDKHVICKECGNPETDIELGSCRACGCSL